MAKPERIIRLSLPLRHVRKKEKPEEYSQQAKYNTA
jgi:hypothetical protein